MLIIVVLIILFISLKFGGSREKKKKIKEPEFDSIYSKIPKKQISNLSSTYFNGIYIIENDPNNVLPVWKITKEKWLYIWNAGYYFLPFARFHLARQYIKELFIELIEYKSNITNTGYKIDKLSHRLTICNKYVLINYTPKLHPVVDYFQEETRMMCRSRGRESHWQTYKKNIPTDINILNFNKNKYDQIQSGLWAESHSCVEIDPETTIGMINWAHQNGYQVTKILDINAGRGSRLVSCIAHPFVSSYTGVDSNPLPHEWYETQSRYFCNLYNNAEIYYGIKHPDNFKVFKGNFLDTALPHNLYNMMFSSPPYTDLETYSDKDDQGTAKNKSVANWIEKFMFKAMDKIMDHLLPGGLMCISMNLSCVFKDDWVAPLIDYKKNCKYLGCVSHFRKGSTSVQPVWVWVKDDLRIDKGIFNDNFLNYYNIRYETYTGGNISKYTKKIKNTLTFLTTENIIKGLPIWSVTNKIIHVINNTHNFIPLACFNTELPVIKKQGCQWYVVEKKWHAEVKESDNLFMGKYTIIKVMTGDINDITYFTDKYTVTCSVQYKISPWQAYLTMKTPQKYKEFGDWCYNMRLLCISSSDSIYIAALEFLRGHFLINNIYIPSSDFNLALFNSLMYVGCDYLYAKSHRQDYADSMLTMYNVLDHNIRNFETSTDEPTGKFDLVYFLPTYYGRNRGDKNPADQYKTYDLWLDALIEEINSLSKFLNDKGIIVFQMFARVISGRAEEFFKSIKLKFIGCFLVIKNSPLSVWVFQA